MSAPSYTCAHLLRDGKPTLNGYYRHNLFESLGFGYCFFDSTPNSLVVCIPLHWIRRRNGQHGNSVSVQFERHISQSEWRHKLVEEAERAASVSHYWWAPCLLWDRFSEMCGQKECSLWSKAYFFAKNALSLPIMYFGDGTLPLVFIVSMWESCPTVW